MKYLTDDGQVFDEIEVAKAHEVQMIEVFRQRKLVEKYVNDTYSESNQKHKTRCINLIMSWYTWKTLANYPPGSLQAASEEELEDV